MEPMSNDFLFKMKEEAIQSKEKEDRKWIECLLDEFKKCIRNKDNWMYSVERNAYRLNIESCRCVVELTDANIGMSLKENLNLIYETYQKVSYSNCIYFTFKE